VIHAKNWAISLLVYCAGWPAVVMVTLAVKVMKVCTLIEQAEAFRGRVGLSKKGLRHFVDTMTYFKQCKLSNRLWFCCEPVKPWKNLIIIWMKQCAASEDFGQFTQTAEERCHVCLGGRRSTSPQLHNPDYWFSRFHWSIWSGHFFGPSFVNKWF